MRTDLGRLRRAFGVGALALVTAGAGFVVAAGPAQAIGTDWYVATDGNDGNGCVTAADPCKTISEAVDRAGNNDTIHVAAGTYAESEINIYKNLTILGATSGTTKVTAPGYEIFYVYGDGGFPTVTFTNLTITGVGVPGKGLVALNGGDGVYVEDAAVNFVNTHVDGSYSYGVDAYHAAIDATGSTFSGNGTTTQDDGVFLNNGAFTADHSTFDGNGGYGVYVAAYVLLKGGARPQAANNFDASAVLDHSTASNNGYGGVGGYDSSLRVSTSTLANNTGVGIENDSGQRITGGIGEVRNSTITGTKPWPVEATVKSTDVPDPAAGILSLRFNDLSASRVARTHAPSSTAKHHANRVSKPSAKLTKRIAALTAPGDLKPGQVAVSGSIVASQATGVADCGVSNKYIVDDGYNASSDAANSCAFSSAKHDLTKTDPKLGTLGNNGGPTKTEAPKKHSPVIDMIPAGKAGCAKSATDQRDLARVQPAGGKCDIGAVELAAKALAIHPNSLPHGKVGKAYSQQLTATGGQFPSYTFKFESRTLPPGLSFTAAGKISGKPTKAGSFTFTVSVNDPAFKTYTIVIDAADNSGCVIVPNSVGCPGPISDTGSHTGSMLTVGAGAILAGFLVMLAAGLVGKRRGRHRNPA